VWRSAERYFTVTLAPPEIEARVRAKLAWLPPEERSYWERVIERSGGIHDSLTFLAISLDSAGHPIDVVSTDPATRLFLDDTTADVLGDSARVRTALRDVTTFVRPYPVGLFVEGLGPLVANDAYAPPAVWDAFRKDPYHSPRVVWGREVNLTLLGLAKHIAAAAADDGERRIASPASVSYVRTLEDALRRVDQAVRASGFKHAELWSYEISRGSLVPIRYGTSSDIQLWSATDLAVQYTLSMLGPRINAP